MFKMAIIGESESIIAFQAVGFDSYQVKPDEAEHTLRKQYRSGKYAIIFISEKLADSLAEVLQEFSTDPFPAISILPLGMKRQEVGMEQLRQICIKATGTDIVSKLK